jgi:hypothetical protein
MCVCVGLCMGVESGAVREKWKCPKEVDVSAAEWAKVEKNFDPARYGNDRSFEAELERRKGMKAEGKVKKDLVFKKEITTELIALYDVGSSGVKVEVVEVNLKTGKYSILFWDRKNTDFEIKPGEDYQSRIEAMKYFERLVVKYFGPVITGRDNDNGVVKEIGIATEGFRNAGDLGKRLAEDINLQTNIRFNIIPQDYEGALMFMGVSNLVKDFDEKRDLVWDIGGGSFQITGLDERGAYEYWGTRIASRSLGDYLLEHFKSIPESELNMTSLAPVSERQIFDMECMTGWLLGKFWSRKYEGWRKENYEAIQTKLKENGHVYGVGAVHNYVVLRAVNNVLKKSQNFYTIKEVQDILSQFANKTNEEIGKLVGEKEMKFVRNFVSSLILVHTIMDKLGIERVEVVDVDNTDGLVAREVLAYQGIVGPISKE